VRLVHLADLHLGFRQYQRLTPAGINQREADVAAAVKRAIDRTIDLRPDVVVIAGDVFHTVRPTNPAILHAFQQFTRLTQAMPDAVIVMVAGNHDTPRTAETGCILRLFGPLGIHVVDSAPRRIRIPERDLSVLAVPDLPGARIAFTPDPDSRYNVLLLHGEVEGVIPRGALDERASMEIPREALGVSRWDYVALGHYHVFRELAPNAFYSGSIEYTSVNPWGELLEERAGGLAGKGIVEYDLERHERTFHHIPTPRPLVDLPSLSARGLTAADIDRLIADCIEGCEGGIDDKIVRLVVRDIPRHIARDLDHHVLREYKRRALHFLLDTRRPEIIRVHGHAAPGRRPSLAETVREKLRSRMLESDIDREALVTLGLHYLTEAEAAAQIVPDPREAVV
jgi:hypothetical protein